MDEQDVRNVSVLLSLPSGIVLIPSYLERLGISSDHQQRYLQYGWLQMVSQGTFKKHNDLIGLQGALYALQFEENFPVHIGAESALALQGCAHYIRLGNPRIFIFSPCKKVLPNWFTKHQWASPFRSIKADLFTEGKELTSYVFKDFSVRISTPEQAILECLYLVPKKKFCFDECKYLMEGLTTLRPSLLQRLLDQCSPKLKRQFLALAQRERHSWLNVLKV